MEAIDRRFRPGFWRLSIPVLITGLVMLFVTALVSTAFEVEHPWISEAVGTCFAVCAMGGVLMFVALLLTRMRLYSDGSTLEASFTIAGIPLCRHSAAGQSWHAVARPGRDQMEFEGVGSYRVEVATIDGERDLFLGPLLCWLFRIECL